MRQLNNHFGRRCATTPMAVHRVKVTFKDEPGEGSGVARSFYTAIAQAFLSNEKLPNLDCIQNANKGTHTSKWCIAVNLQIIFIKALDFFFTLKYLALSQSFVSTGTVKIVHVTSLGQGYGILSASRNRKFLFFLKQESALHAFNSFEHLSLQ